MPKLKLCQIVAVVSGLKTHAQKALTEAHNHRLKPALLSGLYRTYRPVKEDGEQLPSEIQRVQTTVPAVIGDVQSALIEMLDAVFTQDIGNTHAKTDIKIGDKTLLKDVPVTFLMFLEKQAVDLETFIDKLPTLDPAEEWIEDPDIGGFSTRPYDTLKAAKVYRTHIAHPPTEHHPAQCQTYTVDETIGVWTNVKKSGAIRPSDRNRMLSRARALRDAIKVAREEANSTEIEQRKAGAAFLSYVFGP